MPPEENPHLSLLMAPTVKAVAWQPKEGTRSSEEFFRLIMRMCKITLKLIWSRIRTRGNQGIMEAWSKFSVYIQVVMLWAFFSWVFVLAVWDSDVILYCKELWKASSKLGQVGLGLSPLLFCLSSAAVQSRFHSFPLSATEKGQIPSCPQTLTPNRTAILGKSKPFGIPTTAPGWTRTHKELDEGWFVSVSAARHGLCLLSAVGCMRPLFYLWGLTLPDDGEDREPSFLLKDKWPH